MIRVITVGCRLNQAESNQLTGLKPEQLKDYFTSNQQSDFDKANNLIIINTCAVTREATSTSWKMIRRAIKSKPDQPESKVVVTGCLASIEKDKMLATAGIDAVIPQKEKVKLIDTLFDESSNLKSLNYTFANNRTRPIIKIQDGCPNQCSFCIASTIRGKPKSVPLDSVLNEIKSLSETGYKELVLTGLNLGSYGIDINSSLTELIKQINFNSYRIRLSSIEPDTISDDLLDLWQTKRLCRHLHISMQSGDPMILKQMNRKYSPDQFHKLIDMVYNKILDINIGTDIIVGFPNETEQAFNNTLKLVEELPFGYLHVFPFSPRPNTEAAKLVDNVKPADKKVRVHILKEISNKKRQEFHKRFISRELEVIVENKNSALSDNYIRIILPDNTDHLKGQLYNITYWGN